LTAGYAVNLANTHGGNWNITDTGDSGTVMVGSSGNNTLTGGKGGNDIFTGGGGDNTFNVLYKTDTIKNLGNGNDTLLVNTGATAMATVAASGWNPSASSSNQGRAVITTKGYAVNVSQVGGSGNWVITNTGTGTGLTGSANNDTLTGGIAGNDTLTGGGGVDTFIINGSHDLINDLSGNDNLQVNAATLNVTVKSAWTAGAATVINGTVNLTTNGHAVNLAAATGSKGINITDTVGNTIITTSNGVQADSVKVLNGNETIIGFNGQDTISGSAGATVTLDVKGSGSFLTNAADNQLNGVQYVTATAADTTINLHKQSEGFYIDAASGHDTVTGGQGGNTFILGPGDQITGGKSMDTFRLAENSSGATAASAVSLYNFHVGVNTGDVIDYATALKIGGSGAPATSTTAAINQTTGVATFYPGGHLTLNAALTQIVNAFNNSGNVNGDFAFFKLSAAGNEYLYISAGNETSASSHDNLIQLVGISSVTHIDLGGGKLTVTA